MLPCFVSWLRPDPPAGVLIQQLKQRARLLPIDAILNPCWR
jgi:hypothetical protein